MSSRILDRVPFSQVLEWETILEGEQYVNDNPFPVMLCVKGTHSAEHTLAVYIWIHPGGDTTADRLVLMRTDANKYTSANVIIPPHYRYKVYESGAIEILGVLG